MKKRIISLLLVALLLVSIAPFGAMAAGIGDLLNKVNIQFTTQPESKTVNAGDKVEFTAEAEVVDAVGTIKGYLWIDSSSVDEDTELSYLQIVSLIKRAKSNEQTYVIDKASESMQLKCIAYGGSIFDGASFGKSFGYAVSNEVTLTVIGGETPTPDPDPNPDPSTSPDPSETTEPTTSPSPSVDPDTCAHTNLKYVAEKAGTCVAKGQKEHWECTNCGQLFSDAAGTQKTTLSRLDNGMEKDETNHTDLKKVPSKAATCTEEGKIEHWYCSGCKNYYSDANGTVEVKERDVTIKKADHDYSWVADEVANVHYQKCRVCGQTTATSNHSGGTASCKAQAKCEKCGASYGELDATNHVNFEYKNVVKPTETTKGYTGDKYCADCGTFIEKGTEYSAQCAGGCKDLKLVKGTPKTCTEDGTIDYYECPKCHNIYRDEKGTILITEADLVDKCTGHDLHPGTDLFGNINKDNLREVAISLGLSAPQIIQMVRDGTFDLDHIIGMISIKDIDHCSDDQYHWLGCQRCGKTLEDLKSELSAAGFDINEKWYELSRKTPHSGGTATCQQKAVCDECGDAYGELGEHRYDNVVTAPTCTKGGYTKHTCSTCKDTYTDNETTKTGHIIKFGVCESCKGKFANPFYDVSGNDWFYSAVMWGYYNDPQVAAGMDANHFKPKAPCTRAQVVTFLWRAAGRPEPTSSTMKFVDVPYNNTYAPYYKAILWAVENGVTAGTDATHFSPNATVTRAQFVTFLWRYAGEPSPSNLSTSFADVNANSYYYRAVLWAAENGITAGKSATQFAPGAACTRCEVVSFMFRAFSKGIVN